MRSKLLRLTMLVVLSIWVMPAGLLSAQNATASNPDEQKYEGAWFGSYVTNEGTTERLAFTLSKDDKGQWHGSVTFTNPDGEQSAEFKTVQFADGKIKCKIDGPDVEVTIEGQLQGDRIEGTYSVSPHGATDVVERGTWKVTRSAAIKKGQ